MLIGNVELHSRALMVVTRGKTAFVCSSTARERCLQINKFAAAFAFAARKRRIT